MLLLGEPTSILCALLRFHVLEHISFGLARPSGLQLKLM